MTEWIRPVSVPFPTIWATFEGKVEIDGKKRSYWIQDITDEFHDEVIKYMLEDFGKEEALSKYSGTDEATCEIPQYRTFLIEELKYKLGLVCLTKNENGKPIIAAFNYTTLSTPNIEKKILSYKTESKVINTVKFIKTQVDPFEKLGITEYLNAMGLYVLPKYRGEGLGLALLNARKSLCKACGLKVSITLFTSKVSQNLAVRAGFKDLYAISFDEMEKIDPKLTYPGIQEVSTCLRLMYNIYQ